MAGTRRSLSLGQPGLLLFVVLWLFGAVLAYGVVFGVSDAAAVCSTTGGENGYGGCTSDATSGTWGNQTASGSTLVSLNCAPSDGVTCPTVTYGTLSMGITYISHAPSGARVVGGNLATVSQCQYPCNPHYYVYGYYEIWCWEPCGNDLAGSYDSAGSHTSGNGDSPTPAGGVPGGSAGNPSYSDSRTTATQAAGCSACTRSNTLSATLSQWLTAAGSVPVLGLISRLVVDPGSGSIAKSATASTSHFGTISLDMNAWGLSTLVSMIRFGVLGAAIIGAYFIVFG